jgi:hypothetical protein
LGQQAADLDNCLEVFGAGKAMTEDRVDKWRFTRQLHNHSQVIAISAGNKKSLTGHETNNDLLGLQRQQDNLVWNDGCIQLTVEDINPEPKRQSIRLWPCERRVNPVQLILKMNLDRA